MASYRTFTTVGDSGPFVSALVLELPHAVRAEDVDAAQFSVYVERKDQDTGEVVLAREHHADPVALPSRGYVPIRRAFVSNAEGVPEPSGSHVTLSLPELRLTKRIDGDIMLGHLRRSDFRVTQTAALPAEEPGGAPLVGLVWDTCVGDVCPQLTGWHLDGEGTFDGHDIRYAWYGPNLAAVNARRAKPAFGAPKPALERVPLVLWLHGAGEGGGEPYRTITGNKVVALGEADIQGKLGGAAYVLAPSSPTFWMDSGSGSIADDNQSVYGTALKQLVDEFVAAHNDIDRSRIYVGGLSNGGFMTCRLLADYPGFFAAGVAVCAPWNERLATEEEFANIARTPLWFVHVDDDPLVDPRCTALPDYWRLKRMGAQDVHLTYYDHIQDETGVYHDEDGRPQRYIGHLVWINVYHDTVRTEVDGTNVLWEGRPVTLWQWVGQHRL